jgi:Dynamin family
MTNAESALASALDQLAALGTDQDREQIAALRDRLDAARLRVLVAGEAERGKSTLINALLGRSVLPAGVIPLTAVATTVRYGDDPRAEVRFADGHDEKQPLTALPDLVAERGNPGNKRRVAAVTVYLDAPVLAGGVELVDTPGAGSVFAWDTAAAHEALETMDAAGDLQYRLSEATRALARSVELRYQEATSRMRAALRAAQELRSAPVADAEEIDRDLSEREIAARHALALLDEGDGVLLPIDGEDDAT